MIEVPGKMLDWDTEFFGVRIARIEGAHLTDESIAQALQWSRDHQVACLYFLCASDDDRSVGIAEQNGFHLVDVRMELSWRAQAVTNDSLVEVRQFQSSDLPQLQEMASGAYKSTRFYYDRYFSRAKSSELYREWVAKSCDGYADAVFVAPQQDTVGGFITCQLETPRRGRIGLVGVNETARGVGVGQALVKAAQRYFSDQGVDEAFVVTQGRNIAAQRLYQANGFRTHSTHLWYHKWF
ncbi:MAG: GNAT family N-acetyltransferase [Blastocatellia bacterium]